VELVGSIESSSIETSDEDGCCRDDADRQVFLCESPLRSMILWSPRHFNSVDLPDLASPEKFFPMGESDPPAGTSTNL
jgi:hypothetical protein